MITKGSVGFAPLRAVHMYMHMGRVYIRPVTPHAARVDIEMETNNQTQQTENKLTKSEPQFTDSLYSAKV